MNRFSNFKNALQSAMGVLNEGQNASMGMINDDSTQQNPTPFSDIDGKKTAVNDDTNFEGLNMAPEIEAEIKPKGIQLILNDSFLFLSGSAELTVAGNHMLDKICVVIKPLNRRIRVEGHSDNVPIQTERFPSNWELSIARSISVVKYLINNGGIDPRRLSAAGYGDSKPRVANDTDSDRNKNRRVEIILEPSMGSLAGEKQD
jgi:chemotaxis protein MotB